jgi:predicted aminopeptidase
MKPVFSWFYSYFPVLLAVIVLIVISAVCSGCYTMKQGAAMLGYLNRAIPLEELAAREGASGEDIRFVRRVESIRRFALEELGLKESKNYTRYVALDRDFLAAVVSACADDSFTRHEWWFPLVGRLPYKGFFNVQDARRERARLEKKDLDVWIRGVDAFSTLGWFRDPLYSYMKDYSDWDLADLIIHEQVHATVWLRNHSQFNEQLAQFIGNEGARLYMEGLREIYGDEIPDFESAAADTRADRETFISFIHHLIDELDEMYRSSIGREEKLRRKEEIIEAAKIRFDENYDTLFKTGIYRFFIDLPVNNAYLDLYRLYHEEDNYFKELYERAGSDLRQFIAAAKTLNPRLRGNPRQELERALGLR